MGHVFECAPQTSLVNDLTSNIIMTRVVPKNIEGHNIKWILQSSQKQCILLFQSSAQRNGKCQGDKYINDLNLIIPCVYTC